VTRITVGLCEGHRCQPMARSKHSASGSGKVGWCCGRRVCRRQGAASRRGQATRTHAAKQLRREAARATEAAFRVLCFEEGSAQPLQCSFVMHRIALSLVVLVACASGPAGQDAACRDTAGSMTQTRVENMLAMIGRRLRRRSVAVEPRLARAAFDVRRDGRRSRHRSLRDAARPRPGQALLRASVREELPASVRRPFTVIRVGASCE
jgi:hypothetical protein